jgi:Flp pilus assembly protein CpaB
MADLSPVINRLRRSYLRHRRLAAAALAGVAVVAIVHVVAPAPPPRARLAVAAHDLSAGVVLGAGDIRVVRTDPALVPAGADGSGAGLAGRRVAGPMRSGEPFTDRRLVGRALVGGYPGDVVAAPVRIQDAEAVTLLRVGDRVDVYAANGEQAAPADRVVSGSYVVTIPPPDPTTGGREGALVVLAVTPIEAARLAQAGALTQLSVSLLA